MPEPEEVLGGARTWKIQIEPGKCRLTIYRTGAVDRRVQQAAQSVDVPVSKTAVFFRQFT